MLWTCAKLGYILSYLWCFKVCWKLFCKSVYVYVLLPRMNLRFYLYSHGFFQSLNDSLLTSVSQVCAEIIWHYLRLCRCCLWTNWVHPSASDTDLCLSLAINSEGTHNLLNLSTCFKMNPIEVMPHCYKTVTNPYQ